MRGFDCTANEVKRTMEKQEIITGIRDILETLGKDEAPGCREYLSDICFDGELYEEDTYVIASELLGCDEPDPLPKSVRELIEALLFDAFAAGNADALNDLGAQYYDGSRGFDQDFTKAVNCYKLAAEKGSRQAQENLGYCYYYGRNMPVDYEKAFHYFALGAFDGHLISLYKIGDMYQNGYYVEKNPAEAFRIYSHCLNTMTDDAAPLVAGPLFLRAGNCFLNGNGTEADPKKALVCLQKAEAFLYDMVAGGNVMYKKSLQAAIDGQAKARAQLAEALPKKEWAFN